MELRISNTKSKTIETFRPLKEGFVSMYACGMTVYDYAHIGHGRKYTMDDILRRTFEYKGYQVKHVQNVTDVGHLASDEDFGDDKLEKGAQKKGMDVWQTADFFKNDFYSEMQKLNIKEPHIICKATEHIDIQIEMIQKIISNGFGYDTPEAVYFDVSKYPEYTNFSGQKLEDKIQAAREDVATGFHKRNPADFVLWFKRVGHFENHIMHWESPWGVGFPGWHIECSAMSSHYLGDLFDIHTGGIDHIPVHHTNEIAQAKGSIGTELANYWFHTDFLNVDGQKMSKSIGNVFRVSDVVERGFSPLALRYLYLSAHYQSKLNFTWEALEASQNALHKIYAEFRTLPQDGNPIDYYLNEFEAVISENLNTPQALAVLWKLVKDDNVSKRDKRETLLKMDKILGLGLDNISQAEIPNDVKTLAEERFQARKNKDWSKSDELRDKIKSLGFQIEDKEDGYSISYL